MNTMNILQSPFLWAPAAFVAGVLAISSVAGAFIRKLRDGRPLRPRDCAPFLGQNGWSDGVYYGLYFLRNLVLLMFAGALLGGLLYGILGPVFLPDSGWALRMSKGVANGIFFVGLVWGPGLALVSCFVKAHRLQKSDSAASSEVS